MSTPSPFQIGQAVGSNISGAVRASRERGALEQILEQAKGASSPQQQLDLMGEVLRNVSAERRPEVLSYLQDRYKLSREQGALSNYVDQGGDLGAGVKKGQPPNASSNMDQGAMIPQGVSSPQNAIPEKVGTPEAIDQRAREFIRQQPLRYRDIDSARSAAQQEYTNQQNVLSKAEQSFNDYIKRATEKEGSDVYRDLTGEMQNERLQKIRTEALQGKKSPEQIAHQEAQSLLDFAKARTNLRSSQIIPLLTGTLNQQDAKSKLNASRQEYEKNGQLELFENDLVNNVGLSTPVAAYVTYPPQKNSQVSKYLRDTKMPFSLNPFKGSKASQFFYGISDQGSKGSVKRTEEGISRFLEKNIGDNDSLLALAASFNAKGYDPNKILNNLQQSWEKGDLRLNKRQERELQKRTSFGATLNDLAYLSGIGLNPSEVINGG